MLHFLDTTSATYMYYNITDSHRVDFNYMTYNVSNTRLDFNVNVNSGFDITCFIIDRDIR